MAQTTQSVLCWLFISWSFLSPRRKLDSSNAPFLRYLNVLYAKTKC